MTQEGVSRPTPADFAAIFAQSGEAQAVCSRTGIVLAANQAFLLLVRRPEDAVVGASFFDLLDPRERVALGTRLERLLAGPVHALERDVRLVDGRGQRLWGALCLSVVLPDADTDSGGPPLPDPDADVLLVAQLRDITEAKQLEQMLVESERRHRTIFSSLSEGFIQVDGQGAVVEVNDALCRMLGLGRVDLIGRPVTSVLTPEGCATLAVEFVPDAAMSQAFTLSLRHAEGREVLAAVYPARLAESAGGGFIALMVDMTEHRRAERELAVREEHYRTLVTSMQDGLVLIRGVRFDFVNDAFGRILGLDPAVLTGRPFADVIADEDLPRVQRSHERRLRGEPVPNEYEIRLKRADGTLAVVNLHVALVTGADGTKVAVATVKDITERKRAEDERRKLSSALDQAAAAVVITDARGVIDYVNDRFTALTGWTAAELVGRHASALADPEAPAEDAFAQALAGGQAWKGEARALRKDGEAYWETVSVAPVRDDAGAVTHFVAVKEDITQRKETERRVWQQANFDAVTGLPNRVLFQDRLHQDLTRARRKDERLCLMFIDLDRFKLVNDTLGHEAGDELLVEVGRRLTACVRESDTVARLAGDEFTILLPEPGTATDIAAVAERVLAALRRGFVIAGGREVFIGGSIGISIFPDHGEDASTLLKHADAAMYRAKDLGRNTHCVYSEDLGAEAAARLELEGELRQALGRGEIVVLFHPVVDAAERRVTGAEALVRWNHPTRGQLPPAVFLPLAEEIGLIHDIGRHVLRFACAEAAAWRREVGEDAAPAVSVNVSDAQLVQGRLADAVADALAHSGLPPGALMLELSESVLLREEAAVGRALEALSAQGVMLALDDFGTGYASLQHLRRYPFRTLKLHRSFVRDMMGDEEDRRLVETVIAMARALGLQVVAAGVEQPEQLAWLRARYCDSVQGYLFGQPLAPEAFRDTLRRPVQVAEAPAG
ncbi:PAS domain S-box protein [Caenispirillum salinarum]|uniref:bifunctional diguanylate cyclase/phosphodiesterase n=1 Tax=Caenispirillum salinarum TaxID=859058 RepID=UPI00385090A0